MALKIASLILVSLLIAILTACGAGDGGEQPTTSQAPTPVQKTTKAAEPSLPTGAVKVINRDQAGSGEYRFDPAEFKFAVGEEVTFALVSETEFHTFTVDDLGIDVSMEAGETVIYTFTFDKSGTYELICIPHQALGMVGEIVVE